MNSSPRWRRARSGAATASSPLLHGLVAEQLRHSRDLRALLLDRGGELLGSAGADDLSRRRHLFDDRLVTRDLADVVGDLLACRIGNSRRTEDANQSVEL